MAASFFLRRVAPLLFVVLWSTGFIGSKYGLSYAEPLTFLSVRYAIVLALVSVFALATRAPWPRSPREAFHIGMSGLLMHAVYLGGSFTAIHRGLPAGVIAIIAGLQPLLTALGAGLLLGERVSARQWAGLVLGFAGVALVVSKFAASVSAAAVFGQMLPPALVALFGITAGTLYQKRFCPSFNLRTGAVVQFIPTLAVSAWYASHTETMAIVWGGQFIFALAWLVLALSIGAVSLLNLLIRSGSAVNVASLFYLTPPTTALIAWVAFGETLSGLGLFGMAIAVAGVWLARKM